MVTVHCCACGTEIHLTQSHYDNLQRKKEKGSFWCPAGHEQWFLGKTKEEKEIDRLNDVVAEQRREVSRLLDEADYHECLYPRCKYRNKSKKRVREHMLKCDKRPHRLPANAGPDAHNVVVH